MSYRSMYHPLSLIQTWKLRFKVASLTITPESSIISNCFTFNIFSIMVPPDYHFYLWRSINKWVYFIYCFVNLFWGKNCIRDPSDNYRFGIYHVVVNQRTGINKIFMYHNHGAIELKFYKPSMFFFYINIYICIYIYI